MNFGFSEPPLGAQLGLEGFEQLVQQATAVCECKRQEIELANQPLIVVKQAQYKAELERDKELQARIYHARPPHEHKTRRRRIILCWCVVSVLVVAGFILTFLTLEPFQLGRLKALFYSLGIAVLIPYLVDTTLERVASERFVRVLVAVACVVALISLMTLAVIRGELMAKHVQDDSPAVVIEGGDADSAATHPKTSFYDDTLPLLEVVMVLLAFSTEVGAGVALHEAERLSSNVGDSYEELQRRRQTVRERLAELAKETIELQNEPAQFVQKFWHDFHWALLKRAIATAKVFTIGLLISCVFLPLASRAQQRPLELVILIDLSRSVGATGQSDKNEFQENVMGISRILNQVPAGVHITIVGITNDSFGRPYVLLSASVSADTGYFGEKLASAQRQLEIAWKDRSRDLSPSSAGTDLFGALLVASQIFRKAGASRHDVLVIFSDMWQETDELDFDNAKKLCTPQSMEPVKRRGLLADLRDADVYALGTDSPGRAKREWACAHDFWTRYFREAQATLRSYSVLRVVELSRDH